jgi:hypothetical protein
MTPRLFLTLAALLTVSLAWGGAVHSAHAQEVRGAVQIDSPPEELESGSLLDLFAGFREGEHQIHLQFKSDAPFVPVQFQTVVRKDGKRLGRATRDPMPYFPGDMLMGPEAWDFVPILHRSTNREGRLPPGDYEVTLVAENVEGEAGIRPATFGFTVPEQ